MDGSASVAIKTSAIEQFFTTGEETINPIKKTSFDIQTGSFNIIYGPSGSGKSTLLNILTGLQKPTNGTVLFDNQDVYSLSSDELAYFRASKIGLVYQSNYWVNSLNVLENVSLSLYFMGYSRSKSAKMAQDALDRVNMSGYGKKGPQMLSGGEQQRIAMARAIVNNPPFVVADEPTGALDSASGDRIMKLLQSCQADYGQTVILVTHNMEYLPLADNLLHIQDGDIEQMEHSTIHQTTNRLLAEMKKRIDDLSASRQGTK